MFELFNIFKKFDNPHILSVKLEVILKDAFLTTDIKIMDNIYRLPDAKQINKFLYWKNLCIYEKDFYDCDDYTITLWGKIKEKTKGFAVGIASINMDNCKHLVLWYLDNNYCLRYIDAQTKEVHVITQLSGNWILC